MSENKRKIARTQGRFSNEKEFRPSRPNREKQNDQKSSQNQSTSQKKVDEKTKSQASKAGTTAEGISLQYQENATHTFRELEEEQKVEEIREKGVRILSETKNGISRIIYEPEFMDIHEAEELMIILRDSTTWHDKCIIINGQSHNQPRLVAWYGPFAYSYSGAVLDAAEMPKCILDIKAKVQECLRKYNLNVDLNSVLLNLYRNEKDSVAWHSDDELTMGISPTIASVSLGEVRIFEMRTKPAKKNLDPPAEFKVNLKPGSLIIMDGCMQKDWQHRVPKEYHSRAPRINLTFRTVYHLDKVPRIPTEVPYLEDEFRASVCDSSMTQPEHVYDCESFPSLSPANDQKSKISNETDISDKKVSVPTLPDHEDNIERNLDVENKRLVDGFEKKNNLNKNVSHSDGINHFSDRYDVAMNLNLSESEEPSDSKMSSQPELDDNECVSSEARGHPDGDIELNDLSYENEIHDYTEVSDPPEQGPQDFVDSEHSVESGNEAVNRYQLNANAPDFIPQGIADQMTSSQRFLYIGRPLKDLVDVYSKERVHPEDMKEFTLALVEGLKSQRIIKDVFTTRDWYELEVLCELSENGQNEKNQKIINDRICSLTKHAWKYDESRTQRYYQRRSYGNVRNSYFKPNTPRY